MMKKTMICKRRNIIDRQTSGTILSKTNLNIGTSAMPSSMERAKAKAIQAETKYSSNGKRVQNKQRPEQKNLKSNLQIANKKFSSMHGNGKDAI